MSERGPIAITPVAAQDAEDLGAFFALLAARPDVAELFHPHPFTAARATAIATLPRRDRYSLARSAGSVVGYSMLRGWDEGFAIPSFGMCAHPARRGEGIGRALVAHGIGEARAAGADRLRATVHAKNGPSLHLLRQAGFVFEPRGDGVLVGFLGL